MFGFAQPIQRRLPIMPAAAPTAPAPPPPAMTSGPASGTALDQVKAAMNKLGLAPGPGPSASPVADLPTISAPSMPSGAGIEDAAPSIANAAGNVASSAGAGLGDAAATAGEGLGIEDLISALFL